MAKSVTWRIWSRKRNAYFSDFVVDDRSHTHGEWEDKAHRAKSFSTFDTATLFMRSLSYADCEKVSEYEVLECTAA